MHEESFLEQSSHTNDITFQLIARACVCECVLELIDLKMRWIRDMERPRVRKRVLFQFCNVYLIRLPLILCTLIGVLYVFSVCVCGHRERVRISRRKKCSSVV